MRKIRQTFNRKSVTTRILILILINLTIVVAIINVTLFMQIDSIKDSQFQSTSNFFDQYNEFALSQAAQQAKQLLLAVMDSRLIYVNLIRSFIFKNGEEHKFTHEPCVILNENTTFNEQRTGCFFTDEQNSVFDRHTFENLQKILESTWMLELTANANRVKRVNIILQNRNNLRDIMVRTIPRDPDFIIGDVAQILFEMQNRISGVVTLSTPYKDTRSRSDPNLTLISLRSKTVFFTPEKNFTMLIELQLFQRFLSVTLSRVMLSDQLNLVMFRIAKQKPSGYELMASYSPLSPSINYTQLLSPGYKEVSLQNGSSLHSFTLPISSVYMAGQYNGNSKDNVNQDYCYVLTSPSISTPMKNMVHEIVRGVYNFNLAFLALWTSILLGIIFTLTLFATGEIGRSLLFCRKILHDYLHGQDKFENVLNNLHVYSFRWQPFTFILRTIARIIKQIQAKKIRARKIKVKSQNYPLNLLEEDFVDNYFKQDKMRLLQWYQIINKKQNRKKSINKTAQYSKND